MWIRAALIFMVVGMLLMPSGTAQAQAGPRYAISTSVQLELPEHGYTSSSSCTGWEGIANDINDSGEVVGFWPKDEVRGNAFHYDGKRMRRLKGGSGGSEAKAINNSGLIVGALYRDKRESECDPGLNPIPVKWENGEPVELPLPEGAESGVALDVNDDGIVTGEVISGPRELPVVWVDDKVVLPDMNLPDDFVPDYDHRREFWGGTMSSIDADGKVYGTGQVIDSRGIAPSFYAMTWSAGDYHPTVVGEYSTTGLGVGTGTTFVGTYTNTDYDLVTAIFDEGQVLLLPAPDDVENLFQDFPVEPSADGSLIVGYASVIGDSWGYIWQVDWEKPGESKTLRIESLVDELGEWHISQALGINENGETLVLASDAAGVRSFLILDPVSD